MSSQSDPGKQAQKERRGTSNRLVRPLALGFNAQMSTNFFKGDFKLPALHKPFSNLEGSMQGLTVATAVLRVVSDRQAQSNTEHGFA